MRRRLLLAALAAVTAVATIACTDDPPASSAPTRSTATRPGGSTSSERGTPEPGGTLRVALARPSSLDPVTVTATDPGQVMLADWLFDGLTRPGTGEVGSSSAGAQPGVALRWETADRQTWVFRLDPARRFSDGSPLRPSDVVFSLQRVAKRGPSSPVSAQLDVIAGYPAFLAGTAPTLTGVQATSPTDVTISLVRPLATLPELLANPLLGIVPEAAVSKPTTGADLAGAPFGDLPVGSGPLRAEQRKGDDLTLVPQRTTRMLLNRVEVQLHDTDEVAYAAFESGEADLVRVPVSRVADAQTLDGYLTAPTGLELFYAFNLADPALADVRFREAIVHAVDRRAIVTAVYDGTVDELHGLIPNGVPGHRDDACGDRCVHDPDRARQLIAATFGGPPPTLNLDYDEGTTQQAIAQAMADDLQAVGVGVNLRPRPFGEYQDFVLTGSQQLFRLGWFGIYAAPDSFLGPLFRSGAPDNISRFADPAVDGLLAQAGAEADPAARLQLWQAVEDRILATMPILPLGQFRTHLLVGPDVRSLRVDLEGGVDITTVWRKR